MSKTPSSQTRIPTMKLPKPIQMIHDKINEIEQLKNRRAADGEKIDEAKFQIARLMRKNQRSLGVLPASVPGGRKGILYARDGYRVELYDEEKVAAKIERES